MITTRSFTIVLATIAIAIPLGSAWAQKVPVAQASPLQSATDPVMGDWQGTDSNGAPLCAQVIAQGKGRYRVNMLAAFDKGDPPLTVLAGELGDKGLVLIGHQGKAEWSATIADGSFKGKISGRKKTTFELKKTERLSPTLDAKPPEGAIVLFDGSNTNEWEHPPRQTWILDLTQAVGGQDCAAYMRALLWSPNDQKAQLEIGSDDGVKVWLNGTLAHGNNVARAVTPGEDKVAIGLQKGWNSLLLKITQGSGGFGACARIRNTEGKELKGLRAAVNSADLGAKVVPESAVAELDATDGFLMEWQVAGPFAEAGKDASALFDIAFAPEQGGQAEWKPVPKPVPGPTPCGWLILDNGAMEVRNSSIITKRQFTDHRLHVEFRLPFMPEQRGQGRANSGVYVQGRYEVQVLDSYGLEGLDNECGGLYKIARPKVNMCAPPLQWQTYDITFRAPRFDAAGNKTEDAHLTVIHNGVPIHEDLVLPPTAGAVNYDLQKPCGLLLQDHGNPVWFRNIWAVETTDAK